MTAGWGEWRVYRLWLLAQVRINKGGSPECRPPVDFELLLWLLEGSAGVFNQISSEGWCFSANVVFVGCGDRARVRKLVSYFSCCSLFWCTGCSHEMQLAVSLPPNCCCAVPSIKCQTICCAEDALMQNSVKWEPMLCNSKNKWTFSVMVNCNVWHQRH